MWIIYKHENDNIILHKFCVTPYGFTGGFPPRLDPRTRLCRVPASCVSTAGGSKVETQNKFSLRAVTSRGPAAYNIILLLYCCRLVKSLSTSRIVTTNGFYFRNLKVVSSLQCRRVSCNVRRSHATIVKIIELSSFLCWNTSLQTYNIYIYKIYTHTHLYVYI